MRVSRLPQNSIQLQQQKPLWSFVWLCVSKRVYRISTKSAQTEGELGREIHKIRNFESFPPKLLGQYQLVSLSLLRWLRHPSPVALHSPFLGHQKFHLINKYWLMNSNWMFMIFVFYTMHDSMKTLQINLSHLLFHGGILRFTFSRRFDKFLRTLTSPPLLATTNELSTKTRLNGWNSTNKSKTSI